MRIAAWIAKARQREAIQIIPRKSLKRGMSLKHEVRECE